MSTSETEIKRLRSESADYEVLQPEWEVFERTERVTSERLKVAGGWFVRSWYQGSNIESEAEMTSFFYPDVNHAWTLKFVE